MCSKLIAMRFIYLITNVFFRISIKERNIFELKWLLSNRVYLCVNRCSEKTLPYKNDQIINTVEHGGPGHDVKAFFPVSK